jgi:hypothetical protein
LTLDQISGPQVNLYDEFSSSSNFNEIVSFNEILNDNLTLDQDSGPQVSLNDKLSSNSDKEESFDEIMTDNDILNFDDVQTSLVDKKILNIYFHNMSGMRSSLTQFRNDVNNCPYDVICINETWLQDQFLDSEIMPDGWQIFRQNRNLNGDVDRLGGGVFILTRNVFQCRNLRMSLRGNEIFDIVAIELLIGSKRIIIVCFYIPPSAQKEDYDLLGVTFKNLIDTYDNDHEILFFGDANLNDVQWVPNNENDMLFDPMNVDSKYEQFLGILLSLGLFHINDNKNLYGNVLDNFFTNILSDLEFDEAVLTLTDKTSLFHKIYHFKYLYDECLSSRKETKITKFDFANANYDEINKRLSELNLNFDQNVNDVVQDFYCHLNIILHECVPKKTFTKLTCARHLDKPLRILRNRRNKAFKRKDLSIVEHRRFLLLRDKFKMEEEVAFAAYNEKLMLKVIDDPKRFWSTINELKNGKGYPVNMKYKGSKSNDKNIIRKFFSEMFKSVFNNPISFCESDFTHIEQNDDFDLDIVLNINDIINEIESLDKNKGPGHDFIPATFLINTKSNISTILLQIFNKSLSSGIFPDFWKLALVTPIFKSGFRDDVENYRGISILSIFSKIFEKLVVRILKPTIGYLIDKSQHGFENGKSTVTNLAEYSSFLRKNMKSKGQVDSIYTDFSKAFDKVDHELLIFKLKRYGISGPILNWISSYLSNRTQMVSFDNEFSDPVTITSGVPQGSVLGPLLFIMFINDLPKVLRNCECSVFADDLKIFKKIFDADDSLVLQYNLNQVVNWCKVNGMSLNAKKCSIISFHKSSTSLDFTYKIGNDDLERKTLIRDLGVIFDEKLNFRAHIDKIVGNAYSVLGFVKRRAKIFNDPYITKMLYCALVQSILEYACVIWAPYTIGEVNKIESVQKQFLLFALRPLGFTGFILPSYKNRLSLLNMTTLENRRDLHFSLFAFDLLRKRIRVENLTNRLVRRPMMYDMRHQRLIYEERQQNNFLANDCTERAIRIFNKHARYYDETISRNGFKFRILTEMRILYVNNNN